MFKQYLRCLLCALSSLCIFQPLVGQEGPDKITLANNSFYRGTITAYEPSEGIWFKIGEEEPVFYAANTLKRIVFAQKQPGFLPEDRAVNDVIRMKDGAVFQGHILDFTKAEQLSLALDNQTVIVLPNERIYRITYEKRASRSPKSTAAKRDAPTHKAYAFRERGRYSAISAGPMLAEAPPSSPIFIDPFNPFFPSNPERLVFGYNLQYTTGHQYSRWVGVGGGLSFDAYNPERGENMLSVLAEYRTYFTSTRVALYGVLNTGYGFAFRNKEQDISKARGGFLLHPALGLRLGASSLYNFTFDLGYRFQQAEFTQRLPSTGDVEIRELSYKRLLLRVGIVF